MLQVVIPMAGLGSRFQTYGFCTEKYLLPVNRNQETMIEAAMLSLQTKQNKYFDCVKFFCIVRNEAEYEQDEIYFPDNHTSFISSCNNEIYDVISNIAKKHGFDISIITIDKLTDGPACTVHAAKEYLDMTQPLMVVNSDQILHKFQINNFLKKCQYYDGCVLTFDPRNNFRDMRLEIGATDKHSYVQTTGHGIVTKCVEKVILSNKALVGVHYFRQANTFYDAYDYMLGHNLRAPNGEFYLSGCYQSMIEMGNSVGYHNLDDTEFVFPVGEPDDYFVYLYSFAGVYGGYQRHYRQLEDHNILFANGISSIQYLRTSQYKVKNPCLSMLISGTAFAGSANGKRLEKFEMTTADLKLQTECELLLFDMGLLSKILLCEGTCFPCVLNANFVGQKKEKETIIPTENIHAGVYQHHPLETRHVYRLKGCAIHVILEGAIKHNGKTLERGSIYTIHENELSCEEYLDECYILKIHWHPSHPVSCIESM